MSSPKVRALVASVLCVAVASISATVTAAPAQVADPARREGGGLTTLGLQGWRVQSSALATGSGQQISEPGFPTTDWLRVRPDDAGAPGTEVEALVQNGACPNVFFSTNMRDCFGFLDGPGPETIPRFAVPWWFRTDFDPDLRHGQDAKLVVNGVVGQADVWVNGHEVATQATVQGAYTRYAFDVTGLLRPGPNSLALEVFPNDPTSMFTLDDVDWNQVPPDNNTGFQFPIQLQVAPALGIGDAHVLQSNAPDLSRSALTVRADVTNSTPIAQTGVVSATITPPGGDDPIELRQAVRIPALSTRTITFDPARYDELTIRHPEVWWPYQMGAQPLYRLSMSVAQDDVRSVAPSETFGIRTITTHLSGPSPMAPQGARVFEVNGRPFLFRAGGWSEDLLLHYSSSDIANQIAVIKAMGLNGIRTEGKEVPGDFYEQMDRAGIMIDSGFQCCDAWELPQSGRGVTAHDYDVIHLSALTIGQRLRNHPSVINYSWSDNNPIPLQEAVSLQGFAEADFQDPIIASAEYKSTPTLGPSGEKEGPYDWVPPEYWYDTTHFDPTDPSRTNVGGAWAFDSEQSAGDTVPTLDSIRRFLSPFEQAKLWQDPTFNQYHANYEPGWVGYAFGTLFNLDAAIARRYGGWSSLAQYVQMAQVQNYEDTRAQFEAYLDHWNARPTPATGTVYWQLNKGWPTLLWDLYNNDLDQAGSYFGAQEANRTLHALYSYDDGTVAVDNLTGASQSGLKVEARVIDLAGKVLDDQVSSPISLPSQGVANAVLKPRVPAATAPPAPARTYFVELTLRRHGAVSDRNVYWLSTQPDVVDWPNTMGNPQATMLQYGNLQALQSLPAAQVRATARTEREEGPNGADTVTRVTITNTSRTPIAGFFLRADVRMDRGGVGGDDQVLPITWSDNDITLWPGESQTLTASYRGSSLRGAPPVVSVSGWNVPQFQVHA